MVGRREGGWKQREGGGSTREDESGLKRGMRCGWWKEYGEYGVYGKIYSTYTENDFI